ncbi:succinate dehydrogenase iron-sulfur subunit [Usitatibacter palustris]|uniref:Succinate dehydrogenase iron-sulfur subunit n=1 Tax=Usitatibacter palustris TaxID=2732487 RepID=A0A6M4H6T1_9PROT|nr:succinate dehydrogenase iron-sulfur subunit [Usitatibacter palustris]QJR14895.1 Succinate dehydrogenase iron-sulfur subunit [Usitatibacter palustris]
MKFRIQRYNPDKDEKPYFQDYDVEMGPADRMLLDALVRIKTLDDTLSLRRSCREGICGSDAMNINGKNGLACITKIVELTEPVVIKPLPGLPVIRDLIVDMTHFFAQYHSVQPYLVNDEKPPEKERLQSPAERAVLDGLYECILCACCSTACPSFWWNPDKFVGPAGLLNAYRFIADSRDRDMTRRLDDLKDPYRLFRCHTIMNCVDVCPKGLNPTHAIGRIKELMLRKAG